MPKTSIGSDDGLAKAAPDISPAITVAAAEPVIAAEDVPSEPADTPSPWVALKVAVIDDAMHPPRLDRLEAGEAAAVARLLSTNAEVTAELAELGAEPEASADERLRILSETEALGISAGRVGEISADALRMIEE